MFGLDGLKTPNKIKYCVSVTEFSKKSGDYGALSATDIKVIALTYMLEAATVGTAHLKEIPTIKRTTEFYNPKPEAKPQDTVSTAVPGFYMPSDESEEESEDEIEYEEAEVEIDNDQNRYISNDQDPKDRNASLDDLANTLENSEFVEMSSNEVGNLEQEQQGIDTWESSEENEDEGWITPGNYVKKKEQMATINEKELAREVEIACMTSDFAMQVLIFYSNSVCYTKATISYYLFIYIILTEIATLNIERPIVDGFKCCITIWTSN